MSSKLVLTFDTGTTENILNNQYTGATFGFKQGVGSTNFILEQISGGTVTGETIFDAGLSAVTFTGDSILVTGLTANTITTDQLSATTFTGDSILVTGLTANTITTDQLSAVTFTGDSILVTGLTANTINTYGLSATSISADTILVTGLTADTIYTSGLTADTISAITGIFSAITADTIYTSGLTADTISAITGIFSAITADTIYTSGLTADTILVTGLTADTIYTSGLTATTIDLCSTNGTLYTDSISGCSPINVLSETNFTSGLTANTIITEVTELYGGEITRYHLKVSLSAAQLRTAYSSPIDVGLPDSGVGYFYRITNAQFKYNWNSEFFTFDVLYIQNKLSGGYIYLTAEQTFTQPQNSFYEMIKFNGSYLTTGLFQLCGSESCEGAVTSFGNLPSISYEEDNGLEITTNADSIVGDSTVDIYMTVEKVKL